MSCSVDNSSTSFSQNCKASPEAFSVSSYSMLGSRTNNVSISCPPACWPIVGGAGNRARRGVFIFPHSVRLMSWLKSEIIEEEIMKQVRRLMQDMASEEGLSLHV